MSLPLTFQFESWTIKYTLLESPLLASQSTPKTVVFIHGTPWSSATFLPLAKALVSQGFHRALLYDLPGYGQSQTFSSPPPSFFPPTLFEGDTSVRFQARALTALLSQLNLTGTGSDEAPHVVAHDIAGSIALRAHLIHLCKFASLLLMNTNCVLPWGDGFYNLARRSPEVFLKLPAVNFEDLLRLVIKTGSAKFAGMPKYWENILAKPWLEKEEGHKNFVRQIAQANDEDIREMEEGGMYATVDCPVKILIGEKDEWIPREKVERLMGLIGKKNATGLVVIPDAGHLIMVDQPERVMAEVMTWVFRESP